MVEDKAIGEDTELVFVIDDEESVRKAVGRLLRSAGFQTEAFASAQEFLERPRHDGVACLVLDVQMPGLDGLELQEELRKTAYFLPTVFISAHQDALKRVAASSVNVTRTLRKPFEGQELLDAVRAALVESRALRTPPVHPNYCPRPSPLSSPFSIVVDQGPIDAPSAPRVHCRPFSPRLSRALPESRGGVHVDATGSHHR
jgi:DNA-binding response OmpR family regulator